MRMTTIFKLFVVLERAKIEKGHKIIIQITRVACVLACFDIYSNLYVSKHDNEFNIELMDGKVARG